jgi:hypothetical protein
MVPRSILHSVDFEPKTLRSILKVSGCPTTEPTPWGYFRSVINNFEWVFLFFDKSNIISKAQGVQPLIHWGYTKGTRERKRIRKENLQS